MLDLTLPDGVDDAKYPLAHSNRNDGPHLGPIKLIKASGDVFTAVFVLRPATNDPITATCAIDLDLYLGDYSDAQLDRSDYFTIFGLLEWSTGSGVQLVRPYLGAELEMWADEFADEYRDHLDAAWDTAVAWACDNGDLLYRRAMRIHQLRRRNFVYSVKDRDCKIWWWTALEPGLVRDLAAHLGGLPDETAEDLRRIVLGTLGLSEDDAPPMPDWLEVAAGFDKLVH